MKRWTRREFVRAAGTVGLGTSGFSVLGSTDDSITSAERKRGDVEIRYEWLRPGEMVSRRKACPVAYLPIGTLEWHLEHNVLGLDAVKAHGLVMECARRGGGVVFPALFYGENRTEAHVDVLRADEFEVPPENFGPDFMPFTVSEQATHYHHLLIHVLNEIASLGFRFIIVCAGHYPLLDHARAAISVFRQTARRRGHQPTTGWAFSGYELVQDVLPGVGDHGLTWETSLMMALFPGSADLSLLPPEVRREKWVDSVSAEYGRKAIDLIIDRVLARVEDMLKNPGKYLGHCTPM
ncbi:MAG: hypothetical protein A2Z18_09670 [Armatimonadetes bacterium RBG_16_58_9]|nr:MAG: hypothetical protein A2Z18_09670 [Armatimonadetes bacterium RBG_16_58_9]